MGLLTRIDLAALAAYCQSYAELEEATRTLDKEGRVCNWPILDKQGVKIGDKLKSHPAVQQQRDAARLVKQFISEFGLTPASRTRVHGGTSTGEENGRDRAKLKAKFFGRSG